MLSKEQFLKDADLRRAPVELEGVGTIVMRELSVGERLGWRRKWLARLADEATDSDERDTLLSLALVAVSLCVDDGSPMFGDDDIEGAVELLKSKSQRTVETLQKAFLSMNGLDDAAVEEAVGNSSEITSEPSSSGLPVISDTQPSAA